MSGAPITGEGARQAHAFFVDQDIRTADQVIGVLRALGSTSETPADSRPRVAAVRAAAGGDADPAPTTPGAGSADLDAQPDGDES